ncbi:putative ribonuclease H-like domain-containing protein [Tanacetum coccineum]
MDDAKEIWEAIRTRFGGNANSKKMQKAVLKQQFEAILYPSSKVGKSKYDRSNLAMTMRTKPDVDTLSIDDLYNNLRVFKKELTSTPKSSASAQNVAFVSHNKSSTNKVKFCRFTKTNSFKGVPHPLTGDYTPKPQEEIDDSLYIYSKKGPQKPEISDSDDNSTKHSTCQSNDSEGSCGNTSEHTSESESESISVTNEMSTSKVNVNSVRHNVNSVRTNVNTGRSNNHTTLSQQFKSYKPQEIGALLLRPQQVIIGGTLDQTPIVIDHPLKNMEDRGIFDSGCSGHMTGNKDHLDDFEECKGGSVTFGGSKGYITGKGTLQSPIANASEEANEDEELIVVPTAIKHSAAKVRPRKSSPNSKEENTNSVNSGSEPANTQPADQDDSDMPELTIFNKPQKGIFDEASYDEEGMVYDFNNLPTEVAVSPIPTLRIHNIHPQSQILGDPKSSVQTRSRVKQTSGAHALVSYVQKQQRNNHKDQQHCLLACFLYQEEPKKISKALKDDSWVEAMQEELLQFRLQQVWILVDLPHGAKVIGTKWVYRNKRDERGVVVRNKARLVAQGHRQEEGHYMN